MSKLTKIFISLFCLAAFVGTIACQTPAGRSTGDVVDDSAITTKVKTKIIADDSLSGITISVSTFNGTVTLTGAVDNTAQKQHATDVARSVAEVKDVKNLLEIK